MKTLKKAIALFLAVLTTLTVLTGCQQEPKPPDDAITLEEVQALSNADYGATLDEFLIHAIDSEFEVCGVFDGNGNSLIQYCSNDAHGVSLPIEALERLIYETDLTHVHTHPNSDSPFSDGDFLFFTAGNPFEHAIVRTLSTIYYLDPGEAGWPEREEAIAFIQNYAAQVALTMTPEQQAEYYIIDDVRGDVFVPTMKTAQDYAAHFGLKLWSEPAPGIST